MILNVTYDAAALATAPAGFFSAVNYVVALFDATFTNTATVNIEVGYGDFPYDGSLLNSYLGLNQQNNVVSVSYSQVRQALVNEAAPGASTLPSTSPFSGQLQMGSAQEKALGLIDASTALDGWVGIASNAELQQLDGTSWSFSSTAVPTATQYYLIGVIEHEISELMGRNSYLGTRGEYGVIDLYRYAAANVRQTGTGDPAYFSINNGVTNLDSFNNPHVSAGDLSDWAPNAGPSGVFKYAASDAFDNNSLPGQINALTSTDLILMGALGWGAAPASPPPPSPPPPPPPAASPPPPPLPISTAPNDFYGTGSSDILWQNTDGTVAIWEMSGAVPIAIPVIGNPGTSWKAIGSGDFNRDGYSDILWQNTNGTVAIWEMKGAVPIAIPVVGNPGTSWKAVGTGDFTGAGFSDDILWRNTDGTVAIWEMSGANVTADPVVSNPGTSWKVVGTGDFYHRGYSDILWQHTDGTVAIWEMNGPTIIANPVIANPGTSWQAVGAGDFNRDGYADILWQNADGSVAIWEMKGATVAADPVIANPGTSWKAIGTGDFTGDGFADDILWRNTDGTVAIWEMNGATVTADPVIANPGTSWHPVPSGGSSTTAAAGSASSSSTTTASGAGSSGAAFGFDDIAEPVAVRSATASSADIMPVFPNTGGDPLLFPTGSTPPPADPSMPHGTLFG